MDEIDSAVPNAQPLDPQHTLLETAWTCCNACIDDAKVSNTSEALRFSPLAGHARMTQLKLLGLSPCKRCARTAYKMTWGARAPGPGQCLTCILRQVVLVSFQSYVHTLQSSHGCCAGRSFPGQGCRPGPKGHQRGAGLRHLPGAPASGAHARDRQLPAPVLRSLHDGLPQGQAGGAKLPHVLPPAGVRGPHLHARVPAAAAAVA